MPIEYLLDQKNYRISTFPIIHEKMYGFAEKLQSTFWTTDEIKFEKDLEAIKKASEGEKNLLKYIIGYFLTADTDVIDIIYKVILSLIQLPEHRAFENIKVANEQIHAETYSKAAFNFFSNELDMIYDLQNDPAIKEKLSWIKTWIPSPEDGKFDPNGTDFAKVVMAMCLLEGIGFQGLFCAVHVLCGDGKYPGLRFSNELISKDEALHSDFYVYLYENYIVNRLSVKEIHKMIKDLIKIEDRFIEKALEFKVDGMNMDKMKNYVRFVADNHCDRLKILRIYNIENNPFPATKKMNTKVKTNFFEGRDANYSRVDAGDEINYEWKEEKNF